MTTYELWDIETANIVGSFTRVEECLAIVRTLLDQFGSDYADELTLGRRDESAEVLEIATGQRLRTWAQHGVPEPTPR